MSESIFRQSALDRLANPERLDVAQQLVPRAHWLMLGALAAAIVLVLGWATLTKVPVEIPASGVIIGRSGLAEVASPDGGQVSRILVRSGAFVTAGQPVVELNRTDLQRDLAEARAKLMAAQQRYAGLAGFYSETALRDRGVDSIRLGSLSESKAALRDRERYLLDKLGRMRALVGRGFIQRDRVQDTEDELALVREKLAGLTEAGVRVQVEENTKSGQARLALLEEQRTIDEQQRAIASLSAQLAERSFVRAGQAGQITEIKVGVGDSVAAGAAVATVAPEIATGKLVARFYVPSAQGKRVAAGMEARVAPASVERALYGYIEGTVIAVSPLPATREGLRRVLRNDALVEQMFAGGAPIEVLVALQRDPGTPSGYRWSASQGPPRQITPGTEVGGSVVAERRRVIGLLISGGPD